MRPEIQIVVLVFACLAVRTNAQSTPLEVREHDRKTAEIANGSKGDLGDERPDALEGIPASECSTTACSTFGAQHPLAVQSVECGTWSTVASDIQVGNWSLFDVQEGRLYQWSICETNGGFANFAGRLSIWNEAGTVQLCHTEDLCASNPRIRWTASATQTVRVLVSQSDCRNGPGTSATLVWRCLAPPDIAISATKLSFSCGGQPAAGAGRSSGGLDLRGMLLGSDRANFDEAIRDTQAKGGRLLVRVADKFAWFALPRGYVAQTDDHAILSSALDAQSMAREAADSLDRAMGQAFADALGDVAFSAAVNVPPLIGDALTPPALSQQQYMAHLQRFALLDPALPMIRMNMAAEASIQEMVGSVTVALVFVESNGDIDPDTYTWTDADQAATVAGVTSALAWWAEQALDHGVDLSFRVVIIPHTDPRAQQGYEPILHASSGESLWVRAIMANMGLAGEPFAAVTALNTMLKSRYRSDQAYTAFFSYNPAPAPAEFTDGYSAWAYLGGPYTSLLFRSFGWSTTQVFAHETGHIFRACDEYHMEGYGGCLSCGPCAQGVENGNCQFCNPDSVPCMMRVNEAGLCSFTARQVGWPEYTQSQCFDLHNAGNQTLTIDSIDHPSWMEILPVLPMAIVGGASRQLCGSVHCRSCQGGSLGGFLALYGNDPDEVPVVPVQVDCTCAVARVACRCAGGEFHCSVLFPDPDRNGDVITIEVDGVPQHSYVHKDSAKFTGSIGEGSHRVVLVDPACSDVSQNFSCGPP